jgi:hypothetical protein
VNSERLVEGLPVPVVPLASPLKVLEGGEPVSFVRETAPARITGLSKITSMNPIAESVPIASPNQLKTPEQQSGV